MRSVLVALLFCCTCIHATQLPEETRIPIGIRGRDLAPIHYDAVKQMISNHTGFSEFFVLTEDKAASVVLWVFFDPGRLRTLPLEAIAQLQESQRDVEVLPVALRVSPSCSSQPITPKDVEERCDKRCGLRVFSDCDAQCSSLRLLFVTGDQLSNCNAQFVSAIASALHDRLAGQIGANLQSRAKARETELLAQAEALRSELETQRADLTAAKSTISTLETEQQKLSSTIVALNQQLSELRQSAASGQPASEGAAAESSVNATITGRLHSILKRNVSPESFVVHATLFALVWLLSGIGTWLIFGGRLLQYM